MVAWSSSERVSLVEGQSRASSYFAKIPHPTAAVLPPMYKQGSKVLDTDVVFPLVGVEPPFDCRDGIEYGCRCQPAAEKEHEEAAEGAGEAETE